MFKMPNQNLTKRQKVISYLISRLGTLPDGRKKIMKLMFLIEHYDLNKNKVTNSRFLHTNFIIYKYGVFSFEVQEDYSKLRREGIISEYPIKVNQKIPDSGLENDVKSKVDSIITKFGHKNGNELELETLEMLGLTIDSKINYFGEDISDLLKLRRVKNL